MGLIAAVAIAVAVIAAGPVITAVPVLSVLRMIGAAWIRPPAASGLPTGRTATDDWDLGPGPLTL
jgi:hypothetical protein